MAVFWSSPSRSLMTVIQSQITKRSLNRGPVIPNWNGASKTVQENTAPQSAPFSFSPCREEPKTTTPFTPSNRRIAMATDPNYNLHSTEGTINSFSIRGGNCYSFFCLASETEDQSTVFGLGQACSDQIVSLDSIFAALFQTF